MGAGAIDPIIGLFDTHDRCLPRRSVRLTLALCAAALALTACAWDPPTIERTPREAAGTEASAKSRLAARKGTPQTGTAPSGAPGEKIDVPGAESAALEVDVTNFKERLIGLDSDEINDLLGTPGLERAEPPALIWQYRHQVCTVDIFMFDDGGGATVDHVEVRPTTGSNVNEKECFTALLRSAPESGGGASARAPGSAVGGQQPIAPAPSTPVNRRPGSPSAAPGGAAGAAPAPAAPVTRPPTPSTAAPSAAPAVPQTTPDGDDGPPPTDTDIDFDFGPPPASSSSSAKPPAPAAPPPPAASDRPPPSAAPSSEAIPTLPPELMFDEKPPSAAPGPQSSSSSSRAADPLEGIDIPSAAKGDAEEFADPLDSTPPAKPAAPGLAAPLPAPTPAPTLAKPPAPLAAIPSTPTPTPTPAPAVAAPPPAPIAVPSAPPAPAQLAPRPAAAPTATAAAQPKGAPKGAAAAARPAIDIEDDLPPDALTGMRDDDPARNNEDMVE